MKTNRAYRSFSQIFKDLEQSDPDGLQNLIEEARTTIQSWDKSPRAASPAVPPSAPEPRHA